ncbi:MAG: hypothetical protein M3Y33_12845 [Actinomycetota bacterium]|nr:hypothetical protein [Actinomycetota bacterium]
MTPLPVREEKGGLRHALTHEKAAELATLAGEAARVLGCDDAGMEAAEAVIRAGLLRPGGSMLGEGYRDKSFDTVPGLVTLSRAWYHCAACKHGLAPGDAELGVAGTSMSPGLAAMNDKAAAAAPFAEAASLLEELAGVLCRPKTRSRR